MSRRRRLPAGLRERGGRFAFEVRHEKLRGERMVLSMRTGDLERAMERRQAIVTLMERGDWSVIDRIRQGEVHITDVVRAVREGEVRGLRRIGHSATLLGDAVDQFLQRTEATAGSAATYQQYKNTCAVLLEGFGADFPMEDLTVQAAERFLHEPKEGAVGETWAPATQSRHRVIFAALWDLAIQREAETAERAGVDPRMSRNPWRGAKVPEVRATRLSFLHPPEWWALVGKIRGRPHLGLLALAYRAGLRSAEICHLRTDVDVHLEGPEPLVRVQSRGGRHPWKPKTEKSERDVPLTPDAVELLQAHREKYAGDRYFIRPSTEDKPLTNKSAQRWTEEAYEAAGIRYGREGDGLTLHSGRHTYASWLAQEGVPLNVVADLLGNTLDEVYRTYAHLVPDTLRASAMVGYRKLMECKP